MSERVRDSEPIIISSKQAGDFALITDPEKYAQIHGHTAEEGVDIENKELRKKGITERVKTSRK
jgi:hypothetical protein